MDPIGVKEENEHLWTRDHVSRVISRRGKKKRTCARYAKMKSARAKRAKLMFLIVKYANL